MSSGVKDRLRELSQTSSTSDTTIEVPANNEFPPQFQEVFEKVYELRNLIANIKENTKQIKELVQTNNSFSSKTIYDGIEGKVKNTYNNAFKITNILKELDVKSPVKNDDSNKSVLARVKKIQYASLRQDFQNALFESNEFLDKYREQKRIILKKQAALVNASMDDEELEKLLDNPESVNLFTDNILLSTQIAKDQLSQIEERHAELLKIEDLIAEVNGQFKQIAILVEQQKEHINRVEYHACDAINYVDQGIIDLSKAEKKKKTARKTLYITVAVVVVIVLILLIIFVK